MKLLFRHITTTLLRTALLLGEPLRWRGFVIPVLIGALAFINIPANAQTAGLPDAFETMDPATIIGDGNYYYIQFYDGNMRSYLTDCGVGVNAESKDFLPYANNRLWTLLPAGDDNDAHFYLKNKAGHYLYFESGGGARVKCTDNPTTASILQLTSLGDGYRMSSVADNQPMYRNGNAEWSYLPCNAGYYGSRIGWYRIRFAKLKDNAAFIIYYRGEEKGAAGNSSSTLATTRHYLTYSGTAESSLGTNWWSSDVSSRQSIIPKDKALPSLPTVAAYHKDGLWTIEEADVNGQFYIKKYGTNQYLNEDYKWDNVYGSELGSKDATKGTYTLKDPLANRYTLVQNVKYTTESLTADMFYEWDGYGASAQHLSTQPEDKSGFLHLGESLNGGALVAGTGGVAHLTYADLSEYSKMTINGTQGMQLRVLLDRQESDNGPYVEKDVTIGSDGTAVVDLTDLEINRRYFDATVKMTHVNYNDADATYGEIETATSGYNRIWNGSVELGNDTWPVNYITYLQVDASAIRGNILKATLKAKVSGSTDNRRITTWGVGYNSSEWSSDLTWNTAEKSITTVGATVSTTSTSSTTFEDKEFDITAAFSADDDNIVTILVYETAAGGGYFKKPEVVLEYEPTAKEKIDYAHLNAIKAAWGSPSGTINSISLAKVNNTDARYLHHADGDGWQALQWTWDDTDATNGGDENNNWFYAAFYPVEVVTTDEYYRVRLQVGTQMVGVSDDSKSVLKPDNTFNPELWTLEQFGDYRQFRLKSWDNTYYTGLGNTLSETAPTTDLGVFTNSDINSIFSYIEWVRYIPYETRIRHDITHKVSALREYYTEHPASSEQQKVFSEQGLITDVDSEWWNFDSGTQNVNEYVITHYVKQGETVEFALPTVLTTNNDHRLYQRWYKYNDDTNLESLKNHFKLRTNDDGEVMSYLYNNGIVTGLKLDWPEDILIPNTATSELRKFTYYNGDGQRFTLAADVSRYSDFTYLNATDHLDGDLQEPSLTMRYIYRMRDAKEMANGLMGNTEGSDNWLEEKDFHFPATRVAYDDSKFAPYQGEFIGIFHQFKDYWVFNTTDESAWTNDNLVSAVTNKTSGHIEVVVEDTHSTGITLGGKDNKGYYLYDEGGRTGTREYGDSRFVAFKYPSGGTVTATGETNAAYLKVYFNYNGTRYQIAKFKLIFDENTTTLPWTSVNGSDEIQNSERDPRNLEKKAGKPIAKVSFDYPEGVTYENPSEYTYHNVTGGHPDPLLGKGTEIANSSPLPLTFERTNYGFDGDNPSWGSYALVSTMLTTNGHSKTALPANDEAHGYGIGADAGMQSAFLYIDASEQPGEICAVPFVGEFCSGDKLMCTGWISGSNRIQSETTTGGVEYASCPGSVILTVKGERMEDGELVEDDIYRFCPGQCYELDNGTGVDGSTDASHVVWQQFYFEFGINRKYLRQWVEVNNNCVSSTGGDFMLDNIEVYAMVPEVVPEMNSPICVNNDYSEMQLLKLDVGFDKLIVASGVNTEDADPVGGHSFGLVFLNKQVFLETMQAGLSTYNGLTLSLAQVEQNVENGIYQDITNTYKQAYEAAFDAALLGTPTIWDSNNPAANQGAGILNFHWYHHFESNELFTFAKAVNLAKPIFRYTDPETGERFLMMNGNYPKLKWETFTDYYLIYYNDGITDISRRFQDFNICSDCNKEKVFHLEPPYKILSMESSDVTQELEVCEGKIPTVLTDLTAYDYNGVQVTLTDINFDWWLGDPQNGLIATLSNYHNQYNSYGERLDVALSTLRAYYPDATTLDGIRQHLAVSPNPSLTLTMIDYLQSLVDAGQLVLHQRSINIPAYKTSTDDPYCYLVACPIHDGYFDQALNHDGANDVAYFCDEPQGLRMKVGEKAPSLKCGFVPGENGFASYAYPDGNPVLSVRLAKKAQFETVQHGLATEAPDDGSSDSDLHYLWLPIRDADVQSTGSTKVIGKSDDYNIYLASTDDPTWDRNIYTAMNGPTGSLPIVGKIVQLNAIDTDQSSDTEVDNNRLCVYFTENFDVREGYNYTLSLPFKEDGVNTCDGTLLLHLKIVPDYEVWTGGAGNTDWNNDNNWRRADGNTATSATESTDGSARNNNELLVSNDLTNASGLYQYTTNYSNYRTPKDRLLRKGYAPLYCTHILMKSNEWGDAPQLYDALNGKNSLDAAPFPNLSEDYDESSLQTVIDQRFETIDALSGQSFAIVNEADGKTLYGTYEQNLGYGSYYQAVQSSNSGYLFKLEVQNGKYAFRLQTPDGNPYTVWNRDGYLNSQLLDAPAQVSFILGLTNWSNELVYGQDGANLALWEIEPDGSGKFALKNVGTGKYLKDNSVAKYDAPTYFTFCTFKDETVTNRLTKGNILKYDMQARLYDIWSETYGSNPDKGRTGDLIAEMYQINSCDEIAFQPGTELMNAHLLNYNNAWVEYQLDNNRWYLLGSSLQGTIAGEWYAPTGTAQQKTTYYEPVQFSTGYDRYSPAIYQRSWDKAKAVLYEVGASYSTGDNPNDLQLDNGSLPGSTQQGQWSNTTWNDTGADTYLDRLGYKPLGGKKANVAMKGVWSNTYNDATVDYSKGAFSVMVKNDLKNNDQSGGKAIIRLPKEDTMYDYYQFSETGANDGGTDTNLSEIQNPEGLNRAKNRGRLKTDQLLPSSTQRTEASASRYGDQRTYTRVPTQESALNSMTLQAIEETVSAGISNMGYYLVENPFQTGLDMNEFFSVNTGLQQKYWLLTPTGQQLVQLSANDDWISPDGSSFAADEAVLAPGQGFFVQATTAGTATNIQFAKAMQAQTRYGVKDAGTEFTVVVGTKQKMTTESQTITMDDGTTQTVTVEVPVTDGSGNYVVEDITDVITIYNYVQDTGTGKNFPLQSRRTRGEKASGLRQAKVPTDNCSLPGLVITAQRGTDQSSALVMLRDEASNDFLPSEDTEVFINSDLQNVPTVYTLCGRLATTINTIHDFRCLPLGVESASDAPCTLTFWGVEQLGDSIAFYDAKEQKLTPLESGMTFEVGGQNQNRYYLVCTLIQEEAAKETHLQIFNEGTTARVIASTEEPIVSVRCFDTAGRLVHNATPQTPEYTFLLPAAGVCIIEAHTAKDRKTKKVMTRR